MVMKPCLHPIGDETFDKFSFKGKETTGYKLLSAADG
jgi:hypothetical protein